MTYKSLIIYIEKRASYYAYKTGDILNYLIETSKDGEEGFRKAAELVSDRSLKTIFLKRAEGGKSSISIKKTFNSVQY